jgi:SAM-dependent methyltransferase
LEVEFERGIEALNRLGRAKGGVVNAVGEHLPFAAERFDLITSHEVLEHVQDDCACMTEILRTLKLGGRLILFVPNRWYPFETHGIYWKNRYFFGNKLFVNYLPRKLRDRLAPHVNVYTTSDLKRLIGGLPVRVIYHTVIFGAYDNIINRYPRFGKGLRSLLQWLEKTPLKIFGLSQFWVIEKTDTQG